MLTPSTRAPTHITVPIADPFARVIQIGLKLYQEFGRPRVSDGEACPPPSIWRALQWRPAGKIQRLMPPWGLASRHSIFLVAEKLRRFVHRWAHPNFYFFAGSSFPIFFTAVR